MFRKFSNHLASYPLHRHLFFFGCALLAILINGYHFGTFDQVIHITFLKKFVNPNLYPNDAFLSLRWYHFSFFWFPFIPLFKAGILEVSMFIIHILTVYGTIWMFWALSDLLFGSNQSNTLISLALIFPHLGLPGFQIIEFSLLNRTFALPFILGSIWLFLKEKRILSYLLLGIMFNFHVIYAIFVLCMFLLHETLTFKWKSWWKPALGLAVFTLASLPTLIWRMQTGEGIDFSLRPDMLELASSGLLYSIYYPIGHSSLVIGNFFAGVGTLWGFILGYRLAPKNHKHIIIRNFSIAIGILLLVAVITTYLLPITILVQMQILRAGVFMLYIGMLYLSYFLVEMRKKGQITGVGFAILAVSYVTMIMPLFPILLWYLTKLLLKYQKSPAWLVPLIAVIQTLTILVATQSGLWEPGFYIYGPNTPWRATQEWAKDNTPIDAMFISPPYMFGYYTPDWRVFSERAALATIPEMMEIPFDPDFSNSFQRRFSAVTPGALRAFNGNSIRTMQITEQAFYENTRDDFIDLACEFSADYLVVEESHPYPFELQYQNSEFNLYQLPACP